MAPLENDKGATLSEIETGPVCPLPVKPAPPLASDLRVDINGVIKIGSSYNLEKRPAIKDLRKFLIFSKK